MEPVCHRVAEPLVAKGLVGETQIWLRARRLFEAGQITAAKTALGLLAALRALLRSSVTSVLRGEAE